jgi:hypothetical protein
MRTLFAKHFLPALSNGLHGCIFMDNCLFQHYRIRLLVIKKKKIVAQQHLNVISADGLARRLAQYVSYNRNRQSSIQKNSN